MDHLEKIFNEVDIPIDGNVLAEMDFGDISNSQWNESFESISENNFKFCKRTFNRIDNLRRHQSTANGRPFVQTTSSISESSSRIRVHRYSEKENTASISHATNDENTRPIKLSNPTKKMPSIASSVEKCSIKETVLINM
ncbi:hypothetical protein TNCV_3296621 [Trichonephila clavipes]|uniref:C2H2-type domain-containing protein n=1 Tax=Trichonephila clavipes TaxID=2585209 RepID=A0A8X6T2D9_TRICX|nr:hypothetical protein TNCV_3296621 [Trichonephila clavipes]